MKSEVRAPRQLKHVPQDEGFPCLNLNLTRKRQQGVDEPEAKTFFRNKNKTYFRRAFFKNIHFCEGEYAKCLAHFAATQNASILKLH